MKRTTSLGVFSGTPHPIHGIAQLTHGGPASRLQRAVVQSLYEMNGSKEARPLSVAGRPGTYDGEVSFQIGVGNGVYFDYLDAETLGELFELMNRRNALPVLDFLIVVTYHYLRGGKRVALRFDHHLLRFVFHKDRVELLLAHTKGIRRTPLDELLSRVIGRIIREAERQRLK
ncbi:MAG: hypothetical protein ACE5Z5_07455, partial [Candidatus Bathyarchaeia archaeon]